MKNLGKSLVAYSIITMLSLPTYLPAYAYKTPETGKVYKNGTIYTMTDTIEEAKDKSHKAKTVEMVITDAGKIIYAGRIANVPEAYLEGKELVDLKGKTMFPGFIDGHGHFPGYADTNLYKVNLYPTPIGNCDTIATIQERIKNKAEGLPAATKANPITVIGSGYDDTLLDKAPSADLLSINSGNAANVYVSITHISGHLAVINRKLADDLLTIVELDNKKIDNKVIKGIKILPNGEGTTGMLTVIYADGSTSGSKYAGAKTELVNGEWRLHGLLNEIDAMGLADIFQAAPLSAKENAAQKKAKIQYGSKSYASAGVTVANEGVWVPIGFSTDLQTYREYIDQDILNIRVALHPAGMESYGASYARQLLGWDNVTPPSQTSAGVFGTMNRTIEDQHNGDITGTRVTGEDLTRWTYKMSSPLAITSPKLLESNDRPDDFNEKLEWAKIEKLPEYMLILGQHKLFTDGSNQGYTGWMKAPGYYSLDDKAGHIHAPYDPFINGAPIDTSSTEGGKDYSGELYGLAGTFNMSPKDFSDTAEKFHLAGQGFTVHANGTRANEQVVAAIERAVKKALDHNFSIKDTRHTVIHAQTQERQLTQRIVGNYNDIEDQEAGRLPVEYVSLEGLGHPANYGLFDEYHAITDEERKAVIEKNGYESFTRDETKSTAYGNDKTTLREQIGANMKEQNLVSSYFVDHTYYWGDRHKNIFMGPGVAQQISPVGWAVEYGHYYTLHNDTPITEMLPLRSVESAVTRIPYGKDYALTGSSDSLTAVKDFPISEADSSKTKTYWDYDQRVTVLQALLGVTQFGAFSIHAEDKLGSIEKNKFADFVILDEDPFKVAPTDIADIKILTTIVGDNVVHGFLPGSKTLATPPQAAMIQDSDVILENIKSTTSDISEHEKTAYNDMLEKGEKSLALHSFTAEVTENKVATFSMDLIGNGKTIADIKLRKLKSITDFIDYNYSTSVSYTDGKFWITTLDNPNTPMKAGDILEVGKTYIVNFSIKDNGNFDTEPASGKIADPVQVVTSGSDDSTPDTDNPNDSTQPSVSSNGGSGGCTVGTSSHFELLFLLITAFGLAVSRSVRRKQ